MKKAYLMPNSADSSRPMIHAHITAGIYEAHGGIHVRETSGLPAKYFKWYREHDGEDQHWCVSYHA